MSKILALDFGLKRTGIAISDDSKIFAFPLKTVESNELMSELKVIVSKESIEIIVLGLPKRLDTSDSHITANVLFLKEDLEKEFPSLKIHLVDERFTSKMALDSMHQAGASKKQKQTKELVDKVSATIILQSYLQSGHV